jgi:large subunit ribosomal protein L9
MDIILLEKVENLGGLGDKVSVRPGYGRNYLIPKGKAVVASASKLAEFEARRAELEKKAADELQTAQTRADNLGKLLVSISHRAGDEGRLYGSIGTKDISDAVTAAGVELKKSEVRLSSGPIRHIGEFPVQLHLHPEVTASVTIKVVPE